MLLPIFRDKVSSSCAMTSRPQHLFSVIRTSCWKSGHVREVNALIASCWISDTRDNILSLEKVNDGHWIAASGYICIGPVT
jgi:hypothetical protein